MATMTNEQIEQKKQQLKQLAEEVKALKDELVEAGAWPMDEDDLDKAAGGIIWPHQGSHVPDQPWSRPRKEDTSIKPDFKPFPQVKS